MEKRIALAAAFLLSGAAAFAQQGVPQPIPKTRIVPEQKNLEISYYFGEADELADADMSGFTGQFSLPIDERLALNLKATFGEDDESWLKLDVMTIGASIAYQAGEGIDGAPPITVFGGLGWVDTEATIAGITDDDGDFYVEAGAQLELELGPSAHLVPFASFVHFMDDILDDTVFAVGAKVHIDLGPGWEFSGGVSFLFDDVAEGWAVFLGVLREGI